MSFPRVLVDITKIQRNADTLLSWCRERGCEAMFVGKVVCADSAVLAAALPRGFVGYADSRTENLDAAQTALPKLMLRIGTPSRAAEIVRAADISLQSEIETIHALGRAAAAAGRRHKIILMIDLGDLREGVFCRDRDAILAAARAVLAESALELYGTGTNLTCYGSVVPDERNLGELADITNWLRRETGAEIPVISGGNSSSVGLLHRGGAPEGINLLRLGESVLLGTDTATGEKFPQLADDAFLLEAELAELKTKPSKPLGVTSVNAFGEQVEYEDKGPMRRGILAVGRQDFCMLDGLTPVDPAVEIVGASSDHLLVDLTRAPGYRLGDTIQFKLSYGALLGVFTSRYISRDYK